MRLLLYHLLSRILLTNSFFLVYLEMEILVDSSSLSSSVNLYLLNIIASFNESLHSMIGKKWKLTIEKLVHCGTRDQVGSLKGELITFIRQYSKSFLFFRIV